MLFLKLSFACQLCIANILQILTRRAYDTDTSSQAGIKINFIVFIEIELLFLIGIDFFYKGAGRVDDLFQSPVLFFLMHSKGSSI